MLILLERWLGPAYSMVELATARAWHPNPETTEPSELVCPVYDTLSEADFTRYAARPHNAARFVPRPQHMAMADFLTQASKALSESLRARAYVQDERPSYYIYGIRYVPPPDILETLESEDRRPEYLLLGLVGALDIGRLEHGQVALHERTFPDRVAERVALTDATGMTFSPILMGYHQVDHRLNDRLESILGIRRSRLSFDGSIQPLAEATLASTTHLLWRIDELSVIEELREEVRRCASSSSTAITGSRQRLSDSTRAAPPPRSSCSSTGAIVPSNCSHGTGYFPLR